MQGTSPPTETVHALRRAMELGIDVVAQSAEAVGNVLGSKAGRLHHVGVAVRDIEKAAVAMEAGGLPTAPPEQNLYRLLGVTDTLSVCLSHTMSLAGPVHVELLSGPPSSPWGLDGLAQLHHVAFVVEDLASASAALSSSGLPLELTSDSGGHPHTFAYHQSVAGRIELLDIDRAIEIRCRHLNGGGPQ